MKTGKSFFIAFILLFLLNGTANGERKNINFRAIFTNSEGGGSSNGGGTSSGETIEATGTWNISTVNCQSATGITATLTSSTWTLSTSTCTESGTYSISGSTYTAIVTSASGSDCDSVGYTSIETYTLSPETLTFTTSSRDVYAFTKV